MKKLFQILMTVLAILFISAPVFTAGHDLFVQSPGAVVSGIAVLGLLVYFVKLPSVNAFTSGLQMEIWENDIIDNLYKDNEFMQYATPEDQYVLKGKIVHIPQSGTAPNIVKNRTAKPATASTRTDDEVTYTLDEYTSDPVHIPDAETVELSYDKRASVTSESQSKLRQEVAENLLINWAPPVAGVVKTTGGATAATAPSATGSRKLFLPADLKSAMTKLNKANAPLADRYALFPADLYDQFIDSMTATQYRDFSQFFDPKTGIVGRLYGFNILQRSSGLVYDAAYAVKAYGAAGMEDDNEAVLCWQINSVARALGEVKFFEKIGDPQWYGDIYSFLLRMGGRIRRKDNVGVIAIAQDTAA